MSKVSRPYLWRPCLLLLVGAWSVAVDAAPALPGERIRDLEALQARLAEGETAAAMSKAVAQAERLAEGNAADRWARALYLQLASTAAARDSQLAQAADWLREAREEQGVDAEQRIRWLRQEARLRLRDGQIQEGADLLGRRTAEQERDGSVDVEDYWLLAQARSALGQWDEAADWAERALVRDAEPSESRLAMASSVLQRAERNERALEVLDRLLARDPDDAGQWRRAAGLAQRLGDHGRAAAIWEAGWRRGLLEGEQDLLSRVRLHVAGGTPARGAEILQAALDDGALEATDAHRRLLAQAWSAARDRERALAAWRDLAEYSDAGEDWLRLGQMALAWDREPLAVEALRHAAERGVEEARTWLSNLEEDESPARETAGG